MTSSLSRGDAALSSLNSAQRRAVTSSANTVAILAGPGSGKTHTLTSRVVWLVDKFQYKPSDIIVATFTVKAAREMKERIGKALGEGVEKRIVLGTFHSIARRYLAIYGSRIGINPKFTIADDGDSRAILQRICKRLDIGIDPGFARSWISKDKAKGTTGHDAAKAKAEPTSAVEYMKKENDRKLEIVRGEYEEHLRRSNMLDYDDLLVRCVELLKTHGQCVSNIQAVLIDEYQDTNGIQYELMKLFAQARGRITIVGDPDQSIYGWRSAEIKNLTRLIGEYRGTEEIALEENYRSSQAILTASLNVIQQDTARYQKILKPVHNKGTRPVIRKLKTSYEEADWIVSEIKRVKAMTGNMLVYNDMVILLRSAALSRYIESSLGRAGIPYKMIGGFKFYDRVEIKMVLDYLRVIHQPDNNDVLSRILNVPRRGIGDRTIKNLLEEAEIAKLSVWNLLTKHCSGKRIAQTRIQQKVRERLKDELIKTIDGCRKKVDEAALGSTPFNLPDLINHLLGHLDLKNYLAQNYPEDHEQRWANVQEFIVLANDFAMNMEEIAFEESLPDIDDLEQVKETDILGRFLANIALASDAQTGEKSKTDGTDGVVTISTIHAAKGLEWPIVFVAAVYDGSIPHQRSEDLSEERRLLYVAMTRAKVLLYMSRPLYKAQQWGNDDQTEKTYLSQFIPTSILPLFATVGPMFERAVLAEIGRILNRVAPADTELFKDMPLMAQAADDLFPEDPENTRRASYNHRRTAPPFPREGSQPKRQRKSDGLPNESVEFSYNSGYTSTTMDGASNFTISALPGFVSAGAHRAALTEAAAPKKPIKTAAGPRGAAGKAAAGQPKIGGFMVNTSQISTAAGGKVDVIDLVDDEPAVTAKPGPAQQQHSLGRGPLLGRPGTAIRKGTNEPRNNYPGFSSSPGQPPIEIGSSPPPEPTQPATSLHETTSMAGGSSMETKYNRNETLRRRTGAVAPMDRLRKPFKAPTINKRK